MAALQVIGAFASWKYERLVPNSSSRQAAAAHICAGVLLLGIVVSGMLAIIWFAPPVLSLWSGATDLGLLLWWLPIAVAMLCLQLLATSWYVREGELAQVSRARILQSVGYLITAFLCAGLSLSRSGLIISTVVAWSASFLALTPKLGSFVVSVRRLSPIRFFRVLKLTFAEASRTTAVGLTNTISLAAPVILLSQIYSASEVGLYSLVMRLIGTPLTVITSSLALSFWSRSAELAREQRYEALRRMFVRTTFILSVPAIAVLAICFFLPPFVGVILGEEWRAAGPVLTASAPMLIGTVMFSAPNHLVVLRRQELQIIADVLRLVLIIIVVVVAYIEEWIFSWAVLGVATASLAGHIALFSIQLLVHRRIRMVGKCSGAPPASG